MYIEIKDGKLLSWCRNEYLDYTFFDADFDTFSPEKYEVQNGELVDISQTPEYLKKQRLAQIDIELAQADVDYNTVLNTPVEYSNGHKYKPVYINDYILLIASGLSYEVWSDDELYSETMDTAALSELCLFLKGIAEPAYQKRKTDRKALLQEKSTLQGE